MRALARLGITCALGMMCFQATARGQAVVPPPVPGGSVAPAVFHPDVSLIVVGAIPAGSTESLVTPAVAEALAARPVDQLDGQLLDGGIAPMVTSIGHCRLEVARRKRVSPARIATGSLALRWTILGKGQVAAMDVVSGVPIDAEVMDCIRRDARQWRFTPPPGGDLRLQRALVFRFATPSAARP